MREGGERVLFDCCFAAGGERALEFERAREARPRDVGRAVRRALR